MEKKKIDVMSVGIVHSWPGQIRLKRNGFKTKFESYCSGMDESGDAAPLSEATSDLS